MEFLVKIFILIYKVIIFPFKLVQWIFYVLISPLLFIAAVFLLIVTFFNAMFSILSDEEISSNEKQSIDGMELALYGLHFVAKDMVQFFTLEIKANK